MGFLAKFQKQKGGAKAAAAPKKEEAAKAEAQQEKALKPATRGPGAKEYAGDAYRVIMRPLFTEKADRMKASGQYMFEVAMDANKIEVARAIRDLYGVEPVAVRMTVLKGKNVHFGRTKGREKDIKKAIVCLKPGETLTVVEGV